MNNFLLFDMFEIDTDTFSKSLLYCWFSDGRFNYPTGFERRFNHNQHKTY